MSLRYKVLWVDDEIDTIQSFGVNKDIETYLSELGFIPQVDCIEDTNEAKKKIKKEKYDLILSDYNMDEENGDELIKYIREEKIFTEILFYSAQMNFNTVARELYQDRVSFKHLTNDRGYKNLKEKIIWLINQTLKKIQDLNSVRGLVMAETSRLDNIVNEILLQYLNKNSYDLKPGIIKRIKESIKSNLKKSEKLDTKTNKELIKDRLFDADKKARTINELIKNENIEININNFHQSYKKDVIDIRNELAHVKSGQTNGVEYLIIENKDGIEQKKIKHEDFIQIRKNLLKYDKILNDLKEKI
ncbi:MAG: response regulator [Bacteroidales bacterium]|nr:response regulator [Bacteroidales bacterium]